MAQSGEGFILFLNNMHFTSNISLLWPVIFSVKIMERFHSTIRGHHVYKEVRSTRFGEELRETIMTLEDDTILQEISRVCWFFSPKEGK